jgi:hypothetical protein
MGLRVSAKSVSNIPPLDSGIYPAVCVWIVDLGEQRSEKFNKFQRKLLFGFEIIGEDIERGNGPEPRMLSRMFTASLNEKAALRQMLVSWRGKAFTEDDLEVFDVGSMLGESAQVQVLVNDDGRNDIQNIIPLSRGMKAQIPRMELVLFDLDDPDSYGALEKLPDWIREKIEKSTEWAQLNANQERLGMGEDERVDMETGEVTRRPSTSRKAGKAPF